MTRPTSAAGSPRRGLRLPRRLTRHTTGVTAAIRRSRTRMTGTLARPERATPTIADRRREADQALVAADDALLASAEELAALEDPDLPGELRYADETIAPFAAALDAAQADVDSAFALREQASTEPDADSEDGLLEQVQLLARAASARLDAQSRAFDAVRNLDRAVALVVPALGIKVRILRERLDDSVRLSGDLSARFPSIALAAARTDLDQAADRVGFAETSIVMAGELLRSGDRRGAIARARASEAAVRQATVLLDELAGVPDELSRALTGIEILLDQTRDDLAQARVLGALAPSAPPLRFAAATVEWADAARRSDRLDPVATRRALIESDAALVRALGDALDAGVVRHRAEVLDECYTDAAATSLHGATTAIATRRAVVGADARLRLAAARRTVLAAAGDQPQERVEHLQKAERLADQALALAHSDEARAQDRATAAGHGHDDQMVAVVGGILVQSSSAAAESIPSPRAPAPQSAVTAAARLGQMAAVSFGGLATRARRGGAGRF